jgi:parvulin-like peptidyl-prolyl isomerase
MYQRMLYIGLAAAAGLIVLILGIGAFYEYQIKPNQVLANVNGNEITREDYWRYQSVSLYNQARTYEDYALQVTGQQQTQFLTYAAQLDAAREDVWGSTDVSEATISQMVEDQLYVAAAEAEGVDLSDETLQAYALNMYAPGDQQLVTPYPSPTMSPERAQWATETAEAMQTQQAIAMGTPAGSTPVAGATPVGTPGATPVGTPAATPVGTPSAASMANVRSNAEAEFALFQDEVLDSANMSTEQYMDMFVRPLVARETITSRILSDVPQYAPQVEVQHILVGTEDLANQVYARVTGGEDFAEVAQAVSIDTISAPTGGDLGWVTEGQLPDAVSQVAFSTEAGSISQPVESPYGWHIVKVLDKDDNRALTEAQYATATDKAQTAWLEQQRETYGVSSEYYNPTPEPTPETFVPPADAPTPIVATPVPAPDLSATPIAGPIFQPPASPVASPVASPQASPAGSPEASPAS